MWQMIGGIIEGIFGLLMLALAAFCFFVVYVVVAG